MADTIRRDADTASREGTAVTATARLAAQGDSTTAELDLLRSRPFGVPALFGPQVLRAGTAGLALPHGHVPAPCPAN
jgi:hypothetical protein